MRLLTQKWLGRLLLGLVAAVTPLAAAVPATASATPSHTSQVVGHVYVDDNTTGLNTIAAFDRHAGGSLTAQPGSPFIAGGQGTGSGLASQGAIQLSANRRFVIAVDAGSNDISVLRIERDGALRLVPNGVVPSGGAMPVSVAVHGDVIYVANAGPEDTNYSGFRLSGWGVLRPIPGATIGLPSDAQPVSARSGASSARPIQISCSCRMPTTSERGPGPFRHSTTDPVGRSRRLDHRPSATCRPRRAGSRSAPTVGTCSR